VIDAKERTVRKEHPVLRERIPLAGDHHAAKSGNAAETHHLFDSPTAKDAAMAYRTDAPLIKTRPQTPPTDERQELLNKAAAASDPVLVQGYLARARAIPETGPANMPRDAREATRGMIEVLEARATAARDRQLATGYLSRARSLRQWFDQDRR